MSRWFLFFWIGLVILSVIGLADEAPTEGEHELSEQVSATSGEGGEDLL